MCIRDRHTIYKIENQSFCNLHGTYLSDSANNDKIIATALAMRRKCRSVGSFEMCIRDRGKSLMTTQKVVPLPTVLCTPKRKLCCWKMALVMESPRPVPCLPASERER